MLILIFLTALASFPSWAADSPSRYSEAIQTFEKYRRSKLPGIKNEDNLPFLMTHGDATSSVALLIHGYADSPAIMKRTGELLFEQGFNVIGVHLAGHGTQIEDLETIQLEDWDRDVNTGLKIATRLGSDLLVGGFSTGGLFSIELALRYPKNVKGLIALSPAIKMAMPYSGFSCAWNKPWYQLTWTELIARGILKPITAIGKLIPEDDYYRYRQIPIPGICQVVRLQKRVGRKWSKINIPVLTITSEVDGLLDYDSIRNFSEQVSGESQFYAFPWYQFVVHAYMPTPVTNSHFQDVEPLIVDFARRHF